jgi:nucleoside-diphosphate-sugar epimerase
VKVLVIGASGYVGGGIARALKRHGYDVTGTARSPEAHKKVEALGAQAVAADVRDPRSIASAAREAGAVVYSVQLQGDDAFTVEQAALTAALDALAGTAKPLIYTSGVWFYGDTGDRPAHEDQPGNPIALVAQRPALERLVLDSAQRNVRAIVVRPAMVYGQGGGIPMMLVQSAREHGAARHVGDGANFWPMVHVDDVGELYALAIERGKAGDIFNAADDSRLQVSDIARAASKRAGGSGETQTWPIENAREAMGPFADALALSQVISNERGGSPHWWSSRPTPVIVELGA